MSAARSPSLLLSQSGNSGHDDSVAHSPSQFVQIAALCFLLIVFGGIMSGLQQAIMRVSQAELASMKSEGAPREQKVASWLTPLISRRHLTLVTLLVGNAIAMEALPVFMNIIVPRTTAILLSVTAVVLFSEIIPQAVCLKWPTEMAFSFSWLMYLLIFLLYPCTAPIAALLDCLLGRNEDTILSRRALKQFAIMHGEEARGGPLNQDELDIIVGALDLHTRTARDAGTKLDRVFMISLDSEINSRSLDMIMKAGHSRVPIFRGKVRSNIVGVLLVKQLLRGNHEALVSLTDAMYPVLVAADHVSLFALLKRFCAGESHMAVITTNEVDTSDGIRLCDSRKIGSDALNVHRIVTLEDVLETLLRKDIQDEKDVWKPAEDGLKLNGEESLPRRSLSNISQRTGLGSLRSFESMETAYGSIV